LGVYAPVNFLFGREDRTLWYLPILRESVVDRMVTAVAQIDPVLGYVFPAVSADNMVQLHPPTVTLSGPMAHGTERLEAHVVLSV